MKKHYGEIVAHVVRRNGFTITNLAKDVNVNRRSVYNWFNQKELKRDIIFKIGCVIKHDFSNEFPELFESSDFDLSLSKGLYFVPALSATENINWKLKYITLLEKYNEVLITKKRMHELY